MYELHNIMLNERRRHNRVQTTCIHLYKVQKWVKLNYAIRSDYSCRTSDCKGICGFIDSADLVLFLWVLVTHIVKILTVIFLYHPNTLFPVLNFVLEIFPALWWLKAWLQHVCGVFFNCGLFLLPGNLSGLLPNVNHFPRPLLININIDAIIQVHLNKLSWECFPKAFSKLINRSDVPLSTPPFFMNLRSKHQFSDPPRSSGHPQPSICLLFCRDWRSRHQYPLSHLKPIGQISKSYAERNVLGSFLSWLNFHLM